MSQIVLVSLWEQDEIAAYVLDPRDGELRPAARTAVSGRPAPLALDAPARVLHVGRRGTPCLASYRVDPTTGALDQIGEAALPSDPCCLALDATRRWLFSAYYNAGALAVHRVDDSGAVSGEPVQWLRTATGAHMLATERTNRFAFAPHISREDGWNTIAQYRFDAATGALTPRDPPRADPPGPLGPRHFCLHPRLDRLYTSNEQGCSVTVWSLDAESGTLTPVQTVSTLPPGFHGASKCAQIRITPCGRFLYAPNRGHDTIACMRVDPRDGRLTVIGHAPADAVPRVIEVTPSGRFLLAGGLETATLQTYRIDPATGLLRRVARVQVGDGPMWILAAAL
ncbi:MAG: lactonase family protein [Ectothiorhodospiraceae bacterium]|nr:lactonase family protein [Ectothiorhodospiraceae bacterium]